MAKHNRGLWRNCSMSFDIRTIKSFDKKAKKLAKKYPSLKDDLINLGNDLLANPNLGTDLGNNLHKVRMAIGSKGKGKRGGARVITHTAIFSIQDGIITLLTIYDKSEQNDITEKEVEKLLKELNGK